MKGAFRKPWLFTWLLTALSLATIFTFIAATRRLNFDEALALRAGWLLMHDVSARPPFCMPFTLWLGRLAEGISDPGALFLTARLLTALATLVALAWFLTRVTTMRLGAPATMTLVLSNGLFATHGLEFRYDAVITIGWLVIGGLVMGAKRVPYTAGILGVVVGVLALHHLKGAYYAGSGYTIAGLHLYLRRTDRARALLAFHGTILGVVAVWIPFVVALGVLDEFIGVYRTFLTTGLAAQGFGNHAAFLLEAFFVDMAWWLLALSVGIWTLRTKGAGNRQVWLFAFAAVPISFALLHPMPWAYMVVPAIPFVAVLSTNALRSSISRFGGWGVSIPAALFVALQVTLLGTHPWSSYVDSLRASRSTQVAALRHLRDSARPGDSVLDPSGLAYFLPPSSEEWYVDGVFSEAQRAGLWMGPDEVYRMLDADWVVYTYRLQSLPSTVAQQIDLRFQPAVQGVGARVDRATATGPRSDDSSVPRLALQSFWAQPTRR